MSRSCRLTCLGLAAGLASLGGQASAQDYLSPKPMMAPSAPRAATAKPAPRASAAAPKPAASPSQAAGATSGSAKLDVSEEMGDWRLQCFSKPARICQMSQRRINPSTQSLLIWVELTRALAPREANHITVMLPLGFRIAPTLALRADAQTLSALPIVTCVPAGCVHTDELSISGLEMMQRSQALGTEITDLKGQKFALTVSMRGFNEAYLKTATFLRQN